MAYRRDDGISGIDELLSLLAGGVAILSIGAAAFVVALIALPFRGLMRLFRGSRAKDDATAFVPYQRGQTEERKEPCIRELQVAIVETSVPTTPPAAVAQSPPEHGTAEPRATTKRKAVAPKVVEATYRGRLVRSGVETNTTVSKPYESFCVTYEDEQLGANQQLWGADLNRALRESGAQPGDQIEILSVGSTDVTIAGQSKRKRVWAINKLE